MDQFNSSVEHDQLKEWQTPQLMEFDINDVTQHSSCAGNDGCGVFTLS